MNKIAVEVVEPINDIKAAFSNDYQNKSIDLHRRVSIKVRISAVEGTVKICRAWEFKPENPKYDRTWDSLLQPIVNSAEQLKIDLDVTAVVAEYEKAYKEAEIIQKQKFAEARMAKWMDHPIRELHRVAQYNHRAYVLNENFTMEKFLKGETSSWQETLMTTCSYKGRHWGYTIKWDEYRSRNSGKSGAYSLNSCEVEYKTKDGKSHEDTDTKRLSKFYRKSKYTYKPAEIFRVISEDIRSIKSCIDANEKHDNEKKAAADQIKQLFQTEKQEVIVSSPSSFEIRIDTKENKDAYWQKYTGKKVTVTKENNMYALYDIKAKLSKEQLDQVLAILANAQEVKF